MKRIAVIGGGASGLMSALTAASYGAAVCLIEQKDRVGKKILSTGNGRCNYTNLYQTPECYHSSNPDFPWKIISAFDVNETVAFFQELGICPKNRDGYLYPNSDQASSVLDVLRMECRERHVQILTDRKCTEILPKKKHFLIRTTQENITSDSVILCAGSKAAPVTGSDGSGYSLAKRLGHSLIPVLPALVQLKCREKFYKSISGVRIQGSLCIYADGKKLAEDKGEIQMTAYGISGIPVFQVSGYAAEALYQKKQVEAVLNFMPDHTEEECLKILKDRVNTRPHKTLEEFFTGLFSKKMSDLWVRLSGISREKQVGKLSHSEFQNLCRLIQSFRTIVTDTNPFEQAQVCRGGIDTREVSAQTMESLLIPGLYFAGEILDVDGLCGGYNLQWAWSSGRVAGKEAANASD